MKKLKLAFRKAKTHEIYQIYYVLLKAFEPYKKNYTDGAFQATTLSPLVIYNRLLGKKYDVFVILTNNIIVGTVSITRKDQDDLYIRSMAVHPDYQKRGIGFFIIKKIIEIAEKYNIKIISLDTSKPLKKAIKFYKKAGFEFSGLKQDFYGVKIYEMIKKL